MSNFLPGAGLRDVYVKDSGNDANDGSNIIFAKKTLAGAVHATTLLDPPPALFSPASIIDGGSSRYTENLDIPDNTQVALMSCAMQGTGGTLAKAGENAQLSVLTMSTGTSSGEIAYSSNGSARISLDARAIILNGLNQTGCSIDGATDQAFQNVGQILARFDDSTGISITSSGNQPRYFQYNEININGDSSYGITCDTISTGVAAFRVGAITYEDNPLTASTGALSVGINIVNGSLAAYVAEIQMETAVNVSASGDLIIDNLLCSGDIVNDGSLNITSRRLTGDIINTGNMTIRVDEHVSGSVINSGVLNGEISGVRYGTWVDGDEISSSGIVKGGIKNTYKNDCLRRTIDTTTDVIDSILCSYFQKKADPNTVGFRVIDADTGVVYWENKATSFNTIKVQYIEFDLAEDLFNALPSNQVVNLLVQAERVVDKDSEDASCTITFTRTV